MQNIEGKNPTKRGKRRDNLQYTLKELRARNGLTQEQVAEKVGVATLTYRLWEQNPLKIQIGAVYQLANIFGVKIDDIFVGVSTTPEDLK